MISHNRGFIGSYLTYAPVMWYNQGYCLDVIGECKLSPPGFVHHRFYNAGYIFNIPASIFFMLNRNIYFGLGYFIGYISGRWIDPDWDISSISEAEGRAIRELWILGYVIYGISSFYGAIFRKWHRSFLTHFPIVSTSLRILLLYSVPMWYLYSNGILVYNIFQQEFYFGYLVGLSSADFIHYAADKMWDDDGKKFEKYRNKKTNLGKLERLSIIKRLRKIQDGK